MLQQGGATSALAFTFPLHRASRSARGETLALPWVCPEHVHSSGHADF